MRARILASPVIVCALWASAARAATIYGAVVKDGAPLQRVRVELVCGNERDWRPTDDQGAYRLTVPSGGRCQFIVGRARADVVVFGEPVHQDWEYRPQPAPGQLIGR